MFLHDTRTIPSLIIFFLIAHESFAIMIKCQYSHADNVKRHGEVICLIEDKNIFFEEKNCESMRSTECEREDLCLVKGIKNYSPFFKRNVTEIHIISNLLKQLPYDLARFFPFTKILTIDAQNLKEIKNADLFPFKKLVTLNIVDSSIRVLEEELFAGLENQLNNISIRSNMLEHISDYVFSEKLIGHIEELGINFPCHSCYESKDTVLECIVELLENCYSESYENENNDFNICRNQKLFGEYLYDNRNVTRLQEDRVEIIKKKLVDFSLLIRDALKIFLMVSILCALFYILLFYSSFHSSFLYLITHD